MNHVTKLMITCRKLMMLTVVLASSVPNIIACIGLCFPSKQFDLIVNTKLLSRSHNNHFGPAPSTKSPQQTHRNQTSQHQKNPLIMQLNTINCFKHFNYKYQIYKSLYDPHITKKRLCT